MTQTLQVRVCGDQREDTASLYSWLSEASALRVYGDMRLVPAPRPPGTMGGVDAAWISCAVGATVSTIDLITKIIEWRRARSRASRPIVTITGGSVTISIETDDPGDAGEIAGSLEN